MFYSQCLVSKKGSLGAIWIAAYFFKKLKKVQVKDTHIPSSVDQILQKELDVLAYRVLAYLLLGVVRIYSKKVDFLFSDCNRVLIGVKDFVSKEKNREKRNVLLPSSPACFSIVLPERLELDAFDLGILEDFHGGNVKTQEDITLKDGGRVTDSIHLHPMERFDMEEDLLLTFHETFSATHDETRHESFTHDDMDIDEENIRDTTEEAPVKVAEAEPLDSSKSSRDQHDAPTHRENLASDDMLVELQMSEDIRRAQEENTEIEKICTIVQNIVDPESSRDALHRDGYRDISESDKTSVETSREKMRHDGGSVVSECGSPEVTHGIEEEPYGTTRTDGENVIPKMSTLDESEPGSVPEGIEKCRNNSELEMTDFENFHGSCKELSEISKVNLSCFSDMTVSEDPSKGFNATESPLAVTPNAPSSSRISKGKTSPQISIIPTPAAKESSWFSRKRKCLIDDEVIIPNKVMKKILEDSSGLVSKRRNVPYSDCPERSTKRFAYPSKSFLDPLIPYVSLDLRSLFCEPIKLRNWSTTGTPKKAKTARRKKTPGGVLSLGQTETTQEIMKTPQAAALTELKVTVGNSYQISVVVEASSTTSGIAHQTENAVSTSPVVAPETPVRRSEQTEIAPETPVISEQVEIAPETPMRESTSKRVFKGSETYDKETRPASPITSFDEHPPVYCVEDKDLDSILMNEEVKADEGEDLQQETWSARTRKVAKFLEKTFLEQREREEEERVSLLQLCRRRTQKQSARLFYETLVLKSRGYLQVNQDHPYGDVLLKPFTRQQQQQQAC